MNKENTQELIYGKNSVLGFLESSLKVEEIYLSYGIQKDEKILKIKDIAYRKKIKTVDKDKSFFLRSFGKVNHQGVALLGESFKFIDFKVFLDEIEKDIKTKKSMPVVLALEEIKDPQNVGALMRVAAASGIAGVIITKDRTSPITPALISASSGNIFKLKITQIVNLSNILKKLKTLNFWIIGTDVSANKSYLDLDYKMKTVLIMGSEGEGMRSLVKSKCDFLVKVPLENNVESLNVSNAASIILFYIKEKLKI